ncbi:Sin3 associated polypeptide p18 domain-containing protein [Trichoderma austrokoningii]
MASAKGDDEHDAAPFLVRLFHKTGGFPRAEEFASSSPPPYVSIYTWSTCTLNELALELAAAKPNALPNPAIGTRLSFRLVCPGLRGASATDTRQPKFVVKNLGSIVIGEGSPGAEEPEDAGPDTLTRDDFEKDKTLADWRFVVGDYISCAILPPRGDGAVAPSMAARRGSISGGRDGRSSGGFRGGFHAREGSFNRDNGRLSWSGWRDNRLPPGEWRRGERLPEGPSGGPRGRGRW